MKSVILILISITFSFVLFGCSKQEGEDYFPINNGSRYEYSIEFGLESGVQKAKSVSRIDGEEEINGKSYFKNVIVYSGLPGAETEIYYQRKTKNGIYTISGKQKEGHEYLAIPFPINVGKSWDVHSLDGITHYKVEGLETLELIDKRYEKCLKISYTGEIKTKGSLFPTPIDGIYYAAENIGIVRSVWKINGITYDLILQNYDN